MAELFLGNRRLLLFLLIALAAAVPARAQVTFGNIEGVVEDQSGGRMPGVTITVVNTGTNLTRTLVTDAQGHYRAVNLRIGTYDVRAEIMGFSTALEKGLVLQINQTAVVNLTLKPSGIEETVTVSAAVTKVNTVTAETGYTVDNKRVDELPLNGRSFDQLLSLVPGAVDTETNTGFAVNGARPGGNNFVLNGTDANNNYFPENVGARSGVSYTSLGIASIETIQEFKIVTNIYSAEYGKLAGAQVNVVTKSGTNQIHGSAFEFRRDDALQARNYFADRNAPKPKFTRDSFGGSLGGPIRRNKTFFFVTYEGLREWLPSTARGLVPTQLLRDKTPAIYQPLLKYMELPTEPAYQTNGSVNPYVGYATVTVAQRTREDAGSANILHQFSPASTLTGHIQFDDGENATPGSLNKLATSANWSRNTIGNVALTHIFRSNLVSDSRLGINYGPRYFQGQPYGMKDTPADMPVVSITGVTQIGARTDYSFYPTLSWQFLSNVSWLKGAHRVKFGTDIRRVGETFNVGGYTRVNFSSNYDEYFDNKPVSISFVGAQTPKNFRSINYGFYVQDDFQAAKRLNVNLGLRYEHNTPVSEKDRQQSSYQEATRELVVGQPLLKTQWLTLAPRVGLAWDVFGNGRTALRGGYGLFYNALNPTDFVNQAGNPPFSQFYTISRILNPDLTYPIPATFNKSAVVSSVYGFSPDSVTPKLMQYNGTVEQQVSNYTMLTLAYVGSRGFDLIRNRDINRIDPLTKTRPDPRYSSAIVRETTARSSYNSFQASVNRRYHGGYSYQVSYTLGHMMDDGSTSYYGVQDINNLAAEWGDSDFDRRHNLVGNFIFELPFGQGRHWGNNWSKPLDWVLGGWQVNGIGSWRSGRALSIRPGLDVRGDGFMYYQRVNVVEGVDPYIKDWSAGTKGGYLNKAAFALPPTGQYGNSPRNGYRGPGSKSFDMSIFKNTRGPVLAGKKTTIQLRGEFFNALNIPRFGLPNATYTSPDFGKILGASSMRQIQFAAKLIF